MTAVGFVLLMFGLFGANFLADRWIIDWRDYVFGMAILFGGVLVTTGVAVWLWEVMP